MKLNKTLTLNTGPTKLVEERVILQLNSPARAQFVIYSPDHIPNVNKMISLDIGYNLQDHNKRLFLGYIEKVVPMVKGQYKLFCRELAAVLNNPLPLNLRHVDLKAVLDAIHQKTGLNFSIPEQTYSKTLIANFFNLGNGYQAIKQLGILFKIPDFIWQQQAEGVIYIGSWAHSRWADKPVVIPENTFTDQHSQDSAKIMAIPALKPGVVINNKRIETLEFSKNHMILSWQKP